MTTDRLFDEGAALERTQMAWARTGLGLLATSAIAARLTLDESTWMAAVVAAVGGLGAIALLLVGQSRYRAVHEELWTSASAATIGARPATAGVRAATSAAIVLSTVLVVSIALSG
ncbi:MAG: DUF202 domain-containing protein [Mycobacteriales bacterium]